MLRHTTTHTPSICKKIVAKGFGIFDQHVWALDPPPGTPWYQKISQTCLMNISGKSKTLDETSKQRNIFEDMFIEHLWEINPTGFFLLRFNETYFRFCGGEEKIKKGKKYH